MTIMQFNCQSHQKPQLADEKGLPLSDLDLFSSASLRKKGSK